MSKKYHIISVNGKQYLCCKIEETYANVANMSIGFTPGEDEFQEIPRDESLKEKIYLYKDREVCLTPSLYPNGWLALTVENPYDKGDFIVLSTNIERMPAMGLPDRVFVDCNNEPEALEFLVKNGFAEETGYNRQSGFVSYPMVIVDLALVYQHAPETFSNINI